MINLSSIKRVITLLVAVLISLYVATPAYALTADLSFEDLAVSHIFNDSDAVSRTNTEQENALPDWDITQPIKLPQTYIIQGDGVSAAIYSQPTDEPLITYTAEAGSPCYVLEAYADGLWHQILWGDIVGYISTVDLDLSNSDFGYVPNNDQDMRTKTGFTPTQLELCLTDQLSGQGESFAQAEQTYGVNALFLIAICQLESANGTSKLAVNKNNLAGLKTRNGFARFTSFADCIDHLAAMLAEKYLAPTGGFYHGSTIQGTSVTYCGGSTHWIKVVSKNIQKNYQLICAN